MTVGSVLATAVARVLDRSEAVIISPCVYRTADGYATKDIAGPSYNRTRLSATNHRPRRR